MKKNLLLLAGIVLAAGMLGACGSGGQTVETAEESATVVQEESSVAASAEDGTDAGEVTTVTYWNTNSGEKAFVDEIVEEFNSTIGKENNVQIELTHVESSSATQELGVALQNGVGPDIFDAVSFVEYAEKGYIVPLTEVAGLEELLEKNPEMSEGYNSWRDKIYLIQMDRTAIGLAYNKDMFVEAGIVDENGEAKPPTTIAEMVEDAKLLTDTANQKFGFGFPLGWSGAIVDYYICAPSQSTSGLIQGIYDYKTGLYDFSGVKAYSEAYLQMKEDGSLYPGAESLDNDAARARFAEGNIGMMMTVQWDCAVWNDQFPAKCDWGVVAIPVESEDAEYLQNSTIRGSCGIGSRGIEEGKEDAIALVYNYLYSDEMMIKRAERGINIPIRAEIVERCDFSESPKGWEDFCELAKISVANSYGKKEVNLDGLDNYSTEFVNNVWTGKESVDDWISEMTKRYNTGVELYIENAPEDIAAIMNARMDPDLDLSR